MFIKHKRLTKKQKGSKVERYLMGGCECLVRQGVFIIVALDVNWGFMGRDRG